jgi:hypothetical protein
VFDAVITALVFIAGMLLGIRLLAALYAAIDLWYTIRTAWPVVLRRIVGWTGATVVALLLLDGGRRRVLLAGMAVHLLVHVGSWLLVTRAFPRRPGPTPVVE